MSFNQDVTIKCHYSNPWRGIVWELTVNIETFALSSNLKQFTSLLKQVSSADNNLDTLVRIKEILEFLVSDRNISSFPVEKKTFKKFLDKMEVIKL